MAVFPFPRLFVDPEASPLGGAGGGVSARTWGGVGVRVGCWGTGVGVEVVVWGYWCVGTEDGVGVLGVG